MPTYEYACQSCGHHVEVYQRFADAPLTTCGVCGGPLRKVFHPAGILFKGSGFYSTDSRASATRSNGDSSASSKGEKKGETSSTKSTGGETSKPSTAPSRSVGGPNERSA